MRLKKYNFSKEELNLTYDTSGSFSLAGKSLNLSKTTFRQQYLRANNRCIICTDICNTGIGTCEECTKSETYDTDKKCTKCGIEIIRDFKKTKLAWNKVYKCSECLISTNKKCSRECYLRSRKSKLLLQKGSLEYKAYQRIYRQSEQGKLRRRISNLKRKCAKITTCSPTINKYLELLFANPDRKCRYCESVNNLSVEHIIPISREGTHSEDNVDLACLSCNISKGSKTEEEYAVYLEQIK